MFDLSAYLTETSEAVNRRLDHHLPPPTEPPSILHEAMRYSVFAGGKRLRPALCIAAAQAVGGTPRHALGPAAALELLHTYTLIHDDLPAMDNDALRRGRPTCHIAFGEANAILAGDALLTLAFQVLATPDPDLACSPHLLVLELAQAGGSRGVIAGQVEDLAHEGKPLSEAMLRFIHRHKTGDLIRASVRMGALAAGAGEAALHALAAYADDIGLAFQVADDLLNATSTPDKLGKATGSDHQRGKQTFVALYGIDGARAHADRLKASALSHLHSLPGTLDPLRALAAYVVERTQ
ncbi:MAG TPA: polyprenyl synthetase family protein [Kiritimatiellia bacterium]|nr:polyprenyl synthetase family protein [Kiritimatiellia bacterium]